jgi:hypothetical protein
MIKEGKIISSQRGLEEDVRRLGLDNAFSEYRQPTQKPKATERIITTSLIKDQKSTINYYYQKYKKYLTKEEVKRAVEEYRRYKKEGFLPLEYRILGVPKSEEENIKRMIEAKRTGVEIGLGIGTSIIGGALLSTALKSGGLLGATLRSPVGKALMTAATGVYAAEKGSTFYQAYQKKNYPKIAVEAAKTAAELGSFYLGMKMVKPEPVKVISTMETESYVPEEMKVGERGLLLGKGKVGLKTKLKEIGINVNKLISKFTKTGKKGEINVFAGKTYYELETVERRPFLERLLGGKVRVERVTKMKKTGRFVSRVKGLSETEAEFFSLAKSGETESIMSASCPVSNHPLGFFVTYL